MGFSGSGSEEGTVNRGLEEVRERATWIDRQGCCRE